MCVCLCLCVCLGTGDTCSAIVLIKEELIISFSFNGTYIPIHYSIYWIIKYRMVVATIVVKNDNIPGYIPCQH